MSPEYKLKRLLARNCNVSIPCELCPTGSQPILFKHLRTHVSTTHGIRCHRECQYCFGYQKWQKGDVKFNVKVHEHRLQCATSLLKCYNPKSQVVCEKSQPILSEEHMEEETSEETEYSKMIALGQKRMKQLQNLWCDMKKQFDSSYQRRAEASQEQEVQLRKQMNQLREQLNARQEQEAQLQKQMNGLRDQLNASQQWGAQLQDQLNTSQQWRVQLQDQLNTTQQWGAELQETLNLERDLNQTMKEDLKKEKRLKSIDAVITKVTNRKLEDSQRDVEMQELRNQLEAARKGWQTTQAELENRNRQLLKLEQRNILEKSAWK
ncbi:hypothetical protein JTE90_000025 [Oedothorax gibbosus]|uniref:Uncharacterized protein n=1 Tax=Oedothorax gibbosus TaxID=931172 RepID=A0AAV6TLD2_9ARAC|nr:hypothetical protein JTE90_000025 [Oedothorax gibbosus]